MQDELLNAREAARLFKRSYRYFAERLSYAPDFPEPVRGKPRGHRFWWKSTLLAYLKAPCTKNAPIGRKAA